MDALWGESTVEGFSRDQLRYVPGYNSAAWNTWTPLRSERTKKRYGKNPNGLAAAAVYLACKEKKIKRTQKEIAVLSSITELILRQRKDELKKIL